MNLFKEQGVKDYAAAASQIPLIDFGPYFGGEPASLGPLAARVREACENIGFFYALGHGVDEAIIERAFAASRRFHALPLEKKLEVKLNENNIGYLPANASVQGASTVHKATRPNQNESFFISHDRAPDHPEHDGCEPLPQCLGACPDLASALGTCLASQPRCDTEHDAFEACLDQAGCTPPCCDDRVHDRDQACAACAPGSAAALPASPLDPPRPGCTR